MSSLGHFAGGSSSSSSLSPLAFLRINARMFNRVDVVIPISRYPRDKGAIGRRADKVARRVARRGELGTHGKLAKIVVFDGDPDKTEMCIVLVGLTVSVTGKKVTTGAALVGLTVMVNFLVAAQDGRGGELFATVNACDTRGVYWPRHVGEVRVGHNCGVL